MMYQGLYGTFPFTVSDQEVCTFRLVRDFVDLTMAEAMQRMMAEIASSWKNMCRALADLF